MYNLAVKDGLVSPCDYPFKEICTKPCKTVKRALDREQMVKLACLSLHSDAELKRSLDLFLLGCGFIQKIWQRIPGTKRWKYSIGEAVWCAILGVLSLAALAGNTYNPFIYFRF